MPLVDPRRLPGEPLHALDVDRESEGHEKSKSVGADVTLAPGLDGVDAGLGNMYMEVSGSSRSGASSTCSRSIKFWSRIGEEVVREDECDRRGT